MSDPFERLSAEDRERLREEPFPDWLDPMLSTLTDDHFSDPDWLYERKLDGEVVAFEGSRTSFSKLQPRLQVSDPEEARASDVAVFLYVFDVLHLDGRSTRDLPLRARKSVLRAAVAFDDPLRWVSHRNEDGEAWLEEACAKGWEGLIAKRADAPYHHGRSRDWLKFKCVNRQEFVIGGFTEWTRDGRLRHPRYLGLREDKEPQEAVRETPT